MLAGWFAGAIDRSLLDATLDVTELGKLVLADPGFEPAGFEPAGTQDTAKEDRADLVERLACEHQRVFGFEVFPLEGEFLGIDSRDAALDGFFVELAERYDLLGDHATRYPDLRPDHIATQLDHVGQAWARAGETGSAANRFVAERLLSWLPNLRTAVAIEDSPFFVRLLDLTIAYLTLVAKETRPSAGASETLEQPGPPSQLLLEVLQRPAPRRIPAELATPNEEEEEEEDLDPLEIPIAASRNDDQEEQPASPELRALTRNLLNPARSGIYLSRNSIRKLGRALDIPVPFGDRRSMLRALLEHSLAYDRWDDLKEHLTHLSSDLVMVSNNPE